MAAHALAFRVMRLSKPPLQTSQRLELDLEHDFCTDAEAAQLLTERRASAGAASSSGRPAHDPLAGCRMDGVLELPQAFGSLFLGETFHSYVSLSNTSKAAVTDVQCKAELETAKGRTLLHEGPAGRLSLQANAKHSFLIRHDVKEVGAHTLVCSVGYTTAEGERRFLPQYFKFSAANPLAVRTKSRAVHGAILLEACIENSSRSPLVVDSIRFEPAPGLSAAPVGAEPGSAQQQQQQAGPDPALAAYLASLQVISPSGGALNLLYRLEQQAGADPPAGGVVGKLDIKWLAPMGELGRLQTQPIVSPVAVRRDLQLLARQAPASVRAGQPFCVTVGVASTVERRVRQLTLESRPAGAEGPAAKVLSLGPACTPLLEVPAHGSAAATLQFLATQPGLHPLPDIALLEPGSSEPLDTLRLHVQVM